MPARASRLGNWGSWLLANFASVDEVKADIGNIVVPGTGAERLGLAQSS
jgi:penicillin V acylase-like amidase (Ntn superfamily)